MTKRHQEELLDWAKAAVQELEKLPNDRNARMLRDGGKALLREIEGVEIHEKYQGTTV